MPAREPEPPRGGTGQVTDEPTGSDLESYVRDGADLSAEDYAQLSHAIAAKGRSLFTAADIAEAFRDATTTRERRDLIRKIESGKRIEVGNLDSDLVRTAISRDAMNGAGYIPTVPGGRTQVADYIEQVRRVDPQRATDILDAIERGEKPEIGHSAISAIKEARAVTAATGTPRYLKRDATTGEIEHTHIQPTEGPFYEFLPDGRTLNISATGTRRQMASGDLGERMLRERLGGVEARPTAMVRPEAQGAPAPTLRAGDKLGDWDRLPKVTQERGARTFAAIERLHRLDGMPKVHLRMIGDDYTPNETLREGGFSDKAGGEYRRMTPPNPYDFGADHRDPEESLHRVAVSDSIGPDEAGNLIAHEYGHAVDIAGMPQEYDRSYMSAAPSENVEGPRASFLEQDNPVHQAMRQWRSIAEQSPTMAKIVRNTEETPKAREYMTSGKEMWARAYAQWVMRYGGDDALRSDLRRMQRRQERAGDAGLPMVWADDEFEPIARAIEAVMVAKGWRDE